MPEPLERTRFSKAPSTVNSPATDASKLLDADDKQRR
jgi:hypothetical protein